MKRISFLISLTIMVSILTGCGGITVDIGGLPPIENTPITEPGLTCPKTSLPWNISWIPADLQSVVKRINTILKGSGLDGQGATILFRSKEYKINPAFALAMFRNEASFAAFKPPLKTPTLAYRNNNPGNVRPTGECKGKPDGSACKGLYGEISTDGRFGKYSTMADGIKAYFMLLTREYKPGSERNCHNIKCISSAYCPASECCVKMNVNQITEFTQQYQCQLMGLKVDNGGLPSPTRPAYPFQAVIDSPSDGASFAMRPVEITYHATAREGVCAVELSVNGRVVSNVVTPDPKQPLVALKYTWQPTVSGAHVLRVRAQSSNGKWTPTPYPEARISIQGESQPQQQPTQQPTQPPTPTPQPTVTPTPGEVQIYDIRKSGKKFYFCANTCGPVTLTFNIHVTQPEKVLGVVVFSRLWDREGEGTAGWDAGHTMKNMGDGEFTYTYTETLVKNPRGFEFTEFHYQFVVVDKKNNKLAKSEVFKDVQYDICP